MTKKVLFIDGPEQGKTIPWMNDNFYSIRVPIPPKKPSGDLIFGDPVFIDYRVSQMVLFGVNFWIGYSCSENERNKAAFEFFVSPEVRDSINKIKGSF